MKLSKAIVGFEHPAKGPSHCSGCTHFDGKNGCAIVAGHIEPGDWCKRFEAIKSVRKIKHSGKMPGRTR